MTQRAEMSDAAQQFVEHWIDTVQAHPHVLMAEWLYTFGALSALTLHSQPLTASQFDEALGYLDRCARRVYAGLERDAPVVTMLQ
jgi:hypothetical protein